MICYKFVNCVEFVTLLVLGLACAWVFVFDLFGWLLFTVFRLFGLFDLRVAVGLPVMLSR